MNATNPLLRYSEAAHRASGIVRQAIADGHANRWIAIRLSDGGSDGVIYDWREDAIRHQLHEQQCCYVCVPHDDMGPRAAENYLKWHRELYAAGLRLADPDAKVIPMIPQRGLL